MKIDGLVVCVDYWAELELSLSRWQDSMDMLTVVVKADTPILSTMHRDAGYQTYGTDAFYRNGAKFNKAAAMQEAISEAHPWRDWVLLIDADIIPPVDLRERLEAADLEPGYLYGAHRHQADPEHWADHPRKHPQYPDREIAGYFQLFHVSDPAVADRHKIVNTTYTHAGCYDSEFQNRWGKCANMDRKRWLDFPVLHIGEPGVHWCGRGNHEAMRELKMARQNGKRWTDETIERTDDDEPDPEPNMKKTKKRRKAKKRGTKKIAGKKTGRPPGSKTKARRQVDVIPGRCEKCGSTDREPYKHITQQVEHCDTAPDGKPYTRITWRPTRCMNPTCRQRRIDRVYENVPKT